MEIEPIYHTVSIPRKPSTPELEKEPEKEGLEEKDELAPKHRKRPNHITRLKRQRDRLAAENAAMRTALAEITNIIITNSKEINHV